MAEPTPTYDLCSHLAEAGRHAEALKAYEGYLHAHPDDGHALNDAGALLYALGRLDEAAARLASAADRLDGDARGQALWNLAEVHLAAGRPEDASALFPALSAAGVFTSDLANRTAEAFLARGDRGGAVETMIRSLGCLPDQPHLLPIYQELRAARPKVAILCEFPSAAFLGDIRAYLEARFETRYIEPTSREEMAETLRWADVAWLEWCTEQAVIASELPKTCRLVLRLHRFEAFTPFVERVRWEAIDRLVLVGNPAVLAQLRRRVPDIDTRTQVVPIPNGVDLDRFPAVERERGTHLACVGYLNWMKNPGLLLQAFARLYAADPAWRLSFAGRWQDDGVLAQYVAHQIDELGLGEAVRFDGWQDDITAWLADKQYLVSASMVEGHPVSALEAMALGLKPVLHTFPGWQALFPEDYVWRTPEEFCRRILEEPWEPAAYRAFVADRYPLGRQLGAVNRLMRELEDDPVAADGPQDVGGGDAIDAFLDEVAARDAT